MRSLYGAIDGRAQAATQTIRAALSGNDTAIALGVTGQGSAPVLDLCRKLVTAGQDPRQPLHAYRGATLALVVRAIGEAADLETNGSGTRFIRRCERRICPSMRFSERGGS